MNSQFRNSNFGFVLYIAIITLIVSATIFVIWYMTLGYKLGTYQSETRLGNVYIGGLTESEVIPVVDEKVNYWYNDDTITYEVRYQDYIYEFDRDVLLFNFEVSVYDIQQGQTNQLLVNIQPTDRDLFFDEIRGMPYLEDVIDNVDLQKLLMDILHDAALMKSYSVKDIEDYFVDETLNISEIGSSAFTIPEGVQIDHIISAIDETFEDGKVYINSKELFDIINKMGTVMSDAELTVLSSSILELILETNFTINEVHYEPSIDFAVYTVDNFPYYARNTVINKIVDESFSFYNGNESDYYLTIEKIDDFNGRVHLYGLPFEYDIDVDINETELNYITQSTSNISLLQNGYNGVIIEVNRVVTDAFGVIVYDEMILFEFYPPIKEIIYEP